jgi:hypothetical protein
LRAPRSATLTLIALIGAFGVISAVNRTSVMVSALVRGSIDTHSVSAQDSILLQTAVGILNLAPETTVRREMIEDTHEMMSKFAGKPWSTLAHVLPAALFMIFAPLQFSFGLRVPYAGTPESIPVVIFGMLFVYSGIRGFAAIRARDTTSHREWMTRLFAIALGASVQRAISGPLLLMTGHGPRAWFVTSVWIGFGTALLGAEWLIRRDRPLRVLAPA